MPVYEYTCPDCGRFERLRNVARAGEPAPCPGCGEPAPRAFSLAVGSTTGSTDERALRERVGEAEPRTETRRVGSSGARDGHGRPWMIGH